MKRLAILIFLISLRISAFGQDSAYTFSLKPVFNPNRKHQFGFGVGGGVSKLNVKWANSNPGAANRFVDIYSDHNLKFDILLIYQYNFAEHFALRTTFGQMFTSGEIIYKGQVHSENVKFASHPYILTIPLIYKVPYRSKILYFQAGPSIVYNYYFRNYPQNNLRLKELDVQADFGVGIDIFTSSFIVSPELKFSAGFINLKPENGNYFTLPLDKLNRRQITFALTFRE